MLRALMLFIVAGLATTVAVAADEKKEKKGEPQKGYTMKVVVKGMT
ncbi:MAG: hypothetical protein AAF488_02940 [Planctomycetota bacterium]